MGEEDAELLMSQFDDIVTKDFVHAELAKVHAEFAGVREEMRTGFADVRTEFAMIRLEMERRFGDVERRFGEMQRWMIGSVVACSGVVAAIVHTFG